MTNIFQAGITSIVMDDKDNVATLLRDFQKGELLTYTQHGQTNEVTLAEDVQFGHKVAITMIYPTAYVVKYGEVIGAATSEISIGEHVHVHNIEGIRGRGDKKAGGKRHANI